MLAWSRSGIQAVPSLTVLLQQSGLEGAQRPRQVQCNLDQRLSEVLL